MTSVNLEHYSKLIECVGLPGQRSSLPVSAAQWDIEEERVSTAGKVSSQK